MSIDTFKTELEAMDDAKLQSTVEHYVWLSGYAANNPKSEYHAKCDATYAECERRQKPWLYQRGWNSAYRSAGYEPSDYDRKAATEEYWQEKAAT